MVRDAEGQKMSKTKGNVIDPLEITEQYGTDAVRMSLMMGAAPGTDIAIGRERVESARNFANKLWNASRYVLLSLGDERPELPDGADLGVEDRWILSRLERTMQEVERSYQTYDFADISRALHRFIWGEYCDWYIEMSKLYLDGPRARATRAVLLHVLDRILRLLHPIMPFVTEELWTRLRPGDGSIMKAPWPESEDWRDDSVDARIGRMQELVVALRRLKVDHGIPQSQRLRTSIISHGLEDELAELIEPIVSLARLESIDLVESLPVERGTAKTITPAGIEASVSLGDVVDLAKESERLRKRIEETESEIHRFERKLANEQFVAKAPREVIDKERRKLEEARANRDKLVGQLEALA
jgi:valyl-tRNA synthetase